MIIIWGSRSLITTEMTVEDHCLICQEVQDMQIKYHRRWFTFFFFPIFPTSGRTYFIECLYCTNSYKPRPEVDIEDLLDQLRAEYRASQGQAHEQE